MKAPAKKQEAWPRIHATHLTGVISRILVLADGAWAEIVVDGASEVGLSNFGAIGTTDGVNVGNVNEQLLARAQKGSPDWHVHGFP